jgi:hypothetical protein
VRPGSSATTTEYGQPGIICAWPLPLDIGGTLKQAVHHGLRGDHLSFGENK